MRCEPNEFAMIVNDHEEPANNGGVVFVIGRADPKDYALPVDWHCRALSHLRLPLLGASVVVEPGQVVGYRDVELRPLRDRPGADETFEWAGRPWDKQRSLLGPKPQREFAR